MDFLKTCSDNQFELAIVDPPYGIGVNHSIGRRKGDKKSNYKKVTWDSKPPDIDYFNELFRVSKDQIIWGANHFMDLICKRSPCWIVWDKLFSEDVSFASVELAWTSFDSVCKRVKLSSARKNRIHPTQKPVRLYEWILHNYAKQGDTILDTHVGSQSSRIAAFNMGFDFVGCEKDVDYFNEANKRFQNHSAQIRIRL
jgi:site-specific DNA-methyltransferase (adenine-specific)